MKKIITLIITISAIFLLSVSVSALHTIDGGVYMADVTVSADGTAEAPEEVTLAKAENLSCICLHAYVTC